jgi:hypothetical protein
MGKHNKDEEEVSVDAFKDIVAEIAKDGTKVTCVECDKRQVAFREHVQEHIDSGDIPEGLKKLIAESGGTLSEHLEMPARMAQMRMKACGMEEWLLLCAPCAQAIFYTMAADIAQGIAEGLPVCGPCGKPIPAIQMMSEHVDIEPLELEAA